MSELSVVDRVETGAIEKLDILTNYSDAITIGLDVLDSEGIDINDDEIDEIMERRMIG